MTRSKKIAVVALGGNALIKDNEKGIIEEQEKNAYATCTNIIPLLDKYNIIITHGNGPQVGNILLRNFAGYNEYNIPQMPLDVCVADSQGGIGYMIERQMINALAAKKREVGVVSLITQVIINKNDPAFTSPTKPIGPFYPKDKADIFASRQGWKFKKDPRGRGWRRVVASPIPLDIINKNIITSIARSGNIVIAVGGGGIPIYKDRGKFKSAEAVIDKDLATALLAEEIGADTLYIITDVPKVSIRFNKPNQKDIDMIKLKELEEYYLADEFPPGSMGPKIEAAMNFIKGGGKRVIITDNPKNRGTIITK